jgi:hypothetical protein
MNLDSTDQTLTQHARSAELRQVVDVLRSELCKIRSVRSTYWALLSTLAFNVAIAVLLAIFLPSQLSAHERATIDTTRVSLGGMHLSQVACGLLGVLVITSEYATGTIRATFAAVPRRHLVLAAKATVLAAALLGAGAVACLAAYLAFDVIVSGSLRTSLGDPGVLRAVLGGALYLTALGLLGLALGAIIRSGAGAVAMLLGLLFVPSILVQLLPHSLGQELNGYVPMEAGSAIFSTHRGSGMLTPWAGFGVFCVYVVVALMTAFMMIGKRDV